MAHSPICSVSGCSKLTLARAMCTEHYQRWRRHGDPTKRARTKKGEAVRFIVDVAAKHQGSDCVFWPYPPRPDGRGEVRINGRLFLAHRLVCFLVHGRPATPGQEVAHSCGKGHLGCVAGAHLRWATHADNMADMWVHDTVQKGSVCWTARLTEDQVRDIRALRGIRLQSDLAELFEVSPSHICGIQTRRSWGWLE